MYSRINKNFVFFRFIVLIAKIPILLVFVVVTNTTPSSSTKCDLELIHKQTESEVYPYHPYDGGDYGEVFFDAGEDKVFSLISIKRQSKIPCEIRIEYFDVLHQNYDFHDTVYLNATLKCKEKQLPSSDKGKWTACFSDKRTSTMPGVFTKAHSYKIQSTSGKI